LLIFKKTHAGFQSSLFYETQIYHLVATDTIEGQIFLLHEEK